VTAGFSKTTLPAIAVAVLLAGCGITNPYASKDRPAATTGTSTSTSSAVSATATSADDPSDRPAGNYPPGSLTTGPAGVTTTPSTVGAPSALAALERYARIDTNWSARSVGRTQRELAMLSLGQARASALQAAASYSRDSVLLSSHVSNTGTVVVIAPAQTKPGVWVVVTSEKTLGSGDYAGLPAQLHITYAKVTDTAHGYLVTAWSPAS
jgi:hypothetical protein